MSQSGPNQTAAHRRWLCSHLVEIEFDQQRFPTQAAVLEEIDAESAGLGVECPYPVGAILKIKAQDFEISAEITFQLPRETDFFVGARFTEGRWDPTTWKPDHLYSLPEAEKKRSHAAGGQG